MCRSFYYNANVRAAKEEEKRLSRKKVEKPGAIRYSFQLAFKAKTLETNRECILWFNSKELY